ncbi:hypothetical protein BC832DRAFT_401020 [Gaertneriomyces semiglobifer]|nr:hypothetical protein BC832DRAFT_401020 [Gaertneriomyces semiglobifer]
MWHLVNLQGKPVWPSAPSSVAITLFSAMTSCSNRSLISHPNFRCCFIAAVILTEYATSNVSSSAVSTSWGFTRRWLSNLGTIRNWVRLMLARSRRHPRSRPTGSLPNTPCFVRRDQSCGPLQTPPPKLPHRTLHLIQTPLSLQRKGGGGVVNREGSNSLCAGEDT